MEKICKTCGCKENVNYTTIVKKEDKEVGVFHTCEKCLVSIGLIEPDQLQSDFEDAFKEIFGNDYLGSDFN